MDSNDDRPMAGFRDANDEPTIQASIRARDAASREPRETSYTHPDALMHQVEEAIRLAAKLGDDAFDFIEGRGLHAMRQHIEKDVESLRRAALSLRPPRETPDEDRELLRDVVASGIEFDDSRLDYVVIQLARVTWNAAVKRAALGILRSTPAGLPASPEESR